MTFKLTVLGTSSALPTVTKHQTAHVLNVREQFYLLDAGEGVQVGLKKCDINMMKLNHIFISHLHGDHFFGLYGLLSTMGMLGREKDLHIYAPAPIKDIISSHCHFFEKGLNYPIICHELQTKDKEIIYENKVMTVETIPLKHSLKAVGFLFKEKAPELNITSSVIEEYNLSIAERVRAKRGEDIVREGGDLILNSLLTYKPYEPRSFAYCLDTSYREMICDQICGVNLLLHESTFLEVDKKLARKRGHSTAIEAATIALKCGAKKLLLTHFSTRYNTLYRNVGNPFLDEARGIFANCEIAVELESYDIV